MAAWLVPNGESLAVIRLRSRILAKAAVQWVFQLFHVSLLGGAAFPLAPAEGHVTTGKMGNLHPLVTIVALEISDWF